MGNFQWEEVTKDTLTLFKEATDYYRTPRAQHTFIAINEGIILINIDIDSLAFLVTRLH